MARLRRDAIARGAVPVRTRGIVLGECGVPDVLDLVLDVPVVADAAGDLGCLSLFRGQVGHAVDAFRQTCQRVWGYGGLCLGAVGSDAPDSRGPIPANALVSPSGPRAGLPRSPTAEAYVKPRRPLRDLGPQRCDRKPAGG